ncbi:T9SS type A sorting domain-containing protein [Hymenobacter bucti]|uniref:T9SS type A sorting domain-containing protein n=1 Tax=Hymenobacter bucti TaxID=1844114 RepID=A0ABW4QMR5_9BACT
MKKKILFFGMLLASLGLLRGGLVLPAEAAAPAVHHQAAPKAVVEERTLVVYPNPSTGIVHLTISGLEGRRAEVSVLNVIGTVMYRETLSELNEHSTKTLDLSKFANGLYYVKLEANNSSQLCKLIIR